ncbi:hypothetical protein FQN55_008965 [Onygenales sp. PD_40]|nr:hypothetical protein FQN55_008965 [Onygenales sp. PD_40]
MPSAQKVRVKQKKKATTSARSVPDEFPAQQAILDDDDTSSEGESDVDDDNDTPMPKDETEEKLERLLFGDTAGFHDALREEDIEGLEMVLARGAGSDSEGGDEEEEGLEGVDDADLFFLDSGAPGADDDLINNGSALQTALADTDGNLEPPAAWEDSDDDRINVSLAGNNRLRKLRVTEEDDLVSGTEYIRRLRRQFERLHPAPEWANTVVMGGGRSAKRRKTEDGESVGSADEMDVDSDGGEEEMSLQPLARLLQNVGNLTKADSNVKSAGGKRKLRQEVLDIQRMKDVGGSQPSSIHSLTFHPSYPLLLSSGPASTLYLHHISPKSLHPNPLLTSLHIRHTPLHTSTFAPPTGNKIFFSGRRRYFHTWDLDTGKVAKINAPRERKEDQKTMERFKLSPCGRWLGVVGSSRKGGGIVSVLSAETMQWVAEVRVDSRNGVADFAWWGDGEGMCVAGKNGEVSEWDGRERRVVARWVDEGAVGTTVVSLGGRSGRKELGGDRWVAVGSSSGIVNIYDRRPWAAGYAAAAKSGAEEDGDGVPRDPKPTRMLDQLTTPISFLVFSADGQLMVMASRWKKDALRLIHLPSCTVYKNWPTSNTPLGRISAVAVAPTSDMLAVANEQGKIRLWEIHG